MNQSDSPKSYADLYDLHGAQYSSKRLSGGLLFNDYIEGPVINKLLNHSEALEGANVLDIGCGPGIYTRLALKGGARVMAIDASRVMLDVARIHCSDLPSAVLDNCTFANESFEDIDISRYTFDIIIATFMLSYFYDLPQALLKMRMSLDRNGMIVSSILHPMRLFSTGKNSNGYTIGNYFDSGLYSADFLDSQSSIFLRRYNFEQLHSAASYADLEIVSLIEPKANLDSDYPDRSKLEFYSRNPSILILVMRPR